MVVAMLVFLARLVLAVSRALRRVAGRSTPRSIADAERVAGRVFPVVNRARQVAALAQERVIREGMRMEYGLDVTPAPVRPYVQDATFRAVCYAAGLTPPDNGSRDGVDDGFTPTPPRSTEEFLLRLEAHVSQHVQNAAREMVIDTANLNLVEAVSGGGDDDPEELLKQDLDDFGKYFQTEEDWWNQQEWDEEDRLEEDDRGKSLAESNVTVTEDSDADAREVLEDSRKDRIRRENRAARSGPRGIVLGWARVLNGETNCAFCAMLASRGAVYKSEKTAGFEPHTKCDCGCVLAVRGKPWEGDAEAAALQDLWEDARDNPNDYERSRMESDQLLSPASRFRSRWSALVREGKVGQFKTAAAGLAQERVDQMRNPYRVA